MMEPQTIIQMEAQPRANNKQRAGGHGPYGPIPPNRSDTSLPGQGSGGESGGQQDKPDDYIQNVRAIASIPVDGRQIDQNQKHYMSVDENY